MSELRVDISIIDTKSPPMLIRPSTFRCTFTAIPVQRGIEDVWDQWNPIFGTLSQRQSQLRAHTYERKGLPLYICDRWQIASCRKGSIRKWICISCTLVGCPRDAPWIRFCCESDSTFAVPFSLYFDVGALDLRPTVKGESISLSIFRYSRHSRLDMDRHR